MMLANFTSLPKKNQERHIIYILVDASEIWGSPVDMVKYPHYLQGPSTIQTVVGLGISEPSTVFSLGKSGIDWMPLAPWSRRRNGVDFSEPLQLLLKEWIGRTGI